jgi:glucuronate isomerase
MAIEEPESFRKYIEWLGEASDTVIGSYADLMDVLQKRHDFFASMGCRLSDHGLETFYSEPYNQREVDSVFKNTLDGKTPSPSQQDKYHSAFLHDMAVMDARDGWVQQFHVGAIRNNNTKMYGTIGPDTGYDAIHDLPIAAAGHRFFDRLATEDALAKTVLYCLNPKDYEVMTAMAYPFNDGSIPGKMQLGSGWWFLDQESGIRKQIDALSTLGLLSRFVGMLTDSRSFISYPRHEYFRRILCDILGKDIEEGKLPGSEIDFIGKLVEDISYNNARNYFHF